MFWTGRLSQGLRELGVVGTYSVRKSRPAFLKLTKRYDPSRPSASRSGSRAACVLSRVLSSPPLLMYTPSTELALHADTNSFPNYAQ